MSLINYFSACQFHLSCICVVAVSDAMSLEVMTVVFNSDRYLFVFYKPMTMSILDEISLVSFCPFAVQGIVGV